MKRKILFCLLLVLPLLCVRGEGVGYLTTEQFRAQIFNYRDAKDWCYLGERPCVIDFYTTWCGPCKRLAPIMDELSTLYDGQIDFYKVDIERERELAAVFGISSIPQVLYIPMEDKPMLLKGLYPREDIVRILDEFLLRKIEELW